MSKAYYPWKKSIPCCCFAVFIPRYCFHVCTQFFYVKLQYWNPSFIYQFTHCYTFRILWRSKLSFSRSMPWNCLESKTVLKLKEGSNEIWDTMRVLFNEHDIKFVVVTTFLWYGKLCCPYLLSSKGVSIYHAPSYSSIDSTRRPV